MPAEDARAKRNRILIVTTATAFIVPFLASSINLAITSIGKDFNSNVIMLNWVVISFLMVSAAFLLPFGRLADMRGRRNLFLSGVTIMTLATLLCAFSPSLIYLIAFRVLQGIGAAMLFSTSTAMVTEAFPAAERGKVLGINTAAVYIGLSAGPVLGGYLSHFFGWRSLFYFVAVLGLIIIPATLKWVPTDRIHAQNQKYDAAGAALIIVSLISFIYGASSLTTESSGPWAAALGLIVIIIFAFHEIRTGSPLLAVKVLARNKPFAFSNLAALINYSATFSAALLMSYYLQLVKGFGAQHAGSILLIQPLTQAVLSPIAGRLSDKVQPRLVASLGMATCTLGLLLLSKLSSDTSLGLVVANLIILGIGFGLFASPNTNAIMSSVEKREYGVASSTMGTMRLVGQASSMALVSLIFGLKLGKAALSPSLAIPLLGAIKIAFFVFALICLAGIYFSWSRGKLARKERRAQD